MQIQKSTLFAKSRNLQMPRLLSVTAFAISVAVSAAGCGSPEDEPTPLLEKTPKAQATQPHTASRDCDAHPEVPCTTYPPPDPQPKPRSCYPYRCY